MNTVLRHVIYRGGTGSVAALVLHRAHTRVTATSLHQQTGTCRSMSRCLAVLQGMLGGMLGMLGGAGGCGSSKVS